MNVLVLSIDSLRADHLGCYGYRHNTSPNLDALAAEGVLAERCFCPVVPTSPVHTTLFTGQHPITHGIVAHGGDRVPDEDRPWLPTMLQGAGYTTCAVDNLRQIKPWFADGFEFYLDPSHRHGHTWSVPMSLLNTRLLPWLKSHTEEQPWFLFVHCWDPHTPYLPPRELRDMFYEGDDPCDPLNDSLDRFRRQYFHHWFSPWLDQLADDLGGGRRVTDRDYLAALYDAEIRSMDRHVGDLLDLLEETACADDTLLIVLGDHGEMLGENDIFFDHHGLYEPNLHPPLIVRWPNGGIEGGRRLDQLVQHLDLAPTILSAAGMELPEVTEGSDLLPLLTGRDELPVHDALYTCECTWQAGWALRTETHKLLLARGPGLHNQPPRELYDLVNDPDERHNLVLDDWELAEELTAQLEGWIARKLQQAGLDHDPVTHDNLTLGRRAWSYEDDRAAARWRTATGQRGGK